jgi:hypothetical protein
MLPAVYDWNFVATCHRTGYMLGVILLPLHRWCQFESHTVRGLNYVLQTGCNVGLVCRIRWLPMIA